MDSVNINHHLSESAVRLLSAMVEVSALEHNPTLLCKSFWMRDEPFLAFQIKGDKNSRNVDKISSGAIDELCKLGYVQKIGKDNFFLTSNAFARISLNSKSRFQKRVTKYVLAFKTFFANTTVRFIGFIAFLAALAAVLQFLGITNTDELWQVISPLVTP